MKLGMLLTAIILISSNQCVFTEELSVISYVTNLFKRPLTILDLTYDQQYIQQILENKPGLECCYVIFRGDQQIDFKDNRLIILNGFLNSEDAKELVKCEDFDLVIIDKQKSDTATVSVATMLGLYSVILGYNANEFPEISKRFDDNSSAKVLVTHSNAAVTVRPNKILSKAWFLGHGKRYLITNTLRNKFFYKKKIYKIAWNIGINLWTFLCFNGVYPDIKTIELGVYRNFSWRHSDYLPWNVILYGGNKVKAIDTVGTGIAYSNKNKFLLMKKFLYLLWNVSSCRRHYHIEGDLPKVNLSLLPRPLNISKTLLKKWNQRTKTS